MATTRHDAGPGLREVWATWGLYGVIAAAVFATYSRLRVQELYHVSLTGRTGGLSRALVVLNFPVALAAIAAVAIVAARARTRVVTWLSVVAVALCAVTAVPGVVDQADLDAKWVNAVPAAGAGLALALTIYVTRRDGLGPRRRLSGDRLRVLALAIIVLVSIPWIGTELGFLVGRWPILGSIFYSDEWFARLGHARLHRAVHEGHHHGIDGSLLATTAILLSRTVWQLGTRLRRALGAYLALMLVYGLANLAQDFWFEQLVKRRVTEVEIPQLLVPAPTWSWLILVMVAVVVGLLFLRRSERAQRVGAHATRWPLAATAAIVALVAVGMASPAHRHVTQFRTVDGVAYAYAPEGRSHIFLTRAGEDAQLTDSDESELAPEWSRDGKLAFQSNRDGDWDVYVRRRDGSLVQITANGEEDGEPAWSPTGRRLALVSDGDAYVVTAADRSERKLADDVNWPAWSSKGSLVYERDADRRYPAWSPDGRLLARSCRLDDRWHICVVATAGSVSVLTHGDANNFAPAWSPDGSRVAFISDRDGNDQVFVMRADGTDVVRITTGQGDKDTPAWQP